MFGQREEVHHNGMPGKAHPGVLYSHPYLNSKMHHPLLDAGMVDEVTVDQATQIV